MLFYFKSLFDNLLVVKVPFTVLLLLECIPIIFPITSSVELVVWAFYLILFWSWSWLLTAYLLTSNLLVNDQPDPSQLSMMVRKTFFHQLKLALVVVFIAVVGGLLMSFLLVKLASSEELRFLQIFFSGQGILDEQGASFLIRLFTLALVVSFILMTVGLFRLSYGILPLLRGDAKVGLIGSWRKSKGTTRTAFKLALPFTVVSLLFMYFSSYDPAPKPFWALTISVASMLISLPMFFDSLIKYLRFLDSDHID